MRISKTMLETMKQFALRQLRHDDPGIDLRPVEMVLELVGEIEIMKEKQDGMCKHESKDAVDKKDDAVGDLKKAAKDFSKALGWGCSLMFMLCCASITATIVLLVIWLGKAVFS